MATLMVFKDLLKYLKSRLVPILYLVAILIIILDSILFSSLNIFYKDFHNVPRTFFGIFILTIAPGYFIYPLVFDTTQKRIFKIGFYLLFSYIYMTIFGIILLKFNILNLLSSILATVPIFLIYCLIGQKNIFIEAIGPQNRRMNAVIIFSCISALIMCYSMHLANFPFLWGDLWYQSNVANSIILNSRPEAANPEVAFVYPWLFHMFLIMGHNLTRMPVSLVLFLSLFYIITPILTFAQMTNEFFKNSKGKDLYVSFATLMFTFFRGFGGIVGGMLIPLQFFILPSYNLSIIELLLFVRYFTLDLEDAILFVPSTIALAVFFFLIARICTLKEENLLNKKIEMLIISIGVAVMLETHIYEAYLFLAVFYLGFFPFRLKNNIENPKSLVLISILISLIVSLYELLMNFTITNFFVQALLGILPQNSILGLLRYIFIPITIFFLLIISLILWLVLNKMPKFDMVPTKKPIFIALLLVWIFIVTYWLILIITTGYGQLLSDYRIRYGVYFYPFFLLFIKLGFIAPLSIFGILYIKDSKMDNKSILFTWILLVLIDTSFNYMVFHASVAGILSEKTLRLAQMATPLRLFLLSRPALDILGAVGLVGILKNKIWQRISNRSISFLNIFSRKFTAKQLESRLKLLFLFVILFLGILSSIFATTLRVYQNTYSIDPYNEYPYNISTSELDAMWWIEENTDVTAKILALSLTLTRAIPTFGSRSGVWVTYEEYEQVLPQIFSKNKEHFLDFIDEENISYIIISIRDSKTLENNQESYFISTFLSQLPIAYSNSEVGVFSVDIEYH